MWQKQNVQGFVFAVSESDKVCLASVYKGSSLIVPVSPVFTKPG